MGLQKGASELDAGDLVSLAGGIFGLSKLGKEVFGQDEGGGGGRGGSAHAISGFKTSPQPRMGSLEGLPLIAVSLKFELLAGRLRGFLSCPLTLTPKESGNIVLILMIRFGATTSYQSV
ncbi:hypothetical protein ANRL2_03208 [Anaerolineae bacterium]|nr:hypothetical protein ANRL2_03208 [Anaerolineae bacterium]